MTPEWARDLVAVAALTVAAGVALLVGGVPRALEVALALPLLVVLPGYALVSALVPTAPDDAGPDVLRRGSSGWPVRLAVAVAGSVLVVGSVATVAAVVWSLRLVPVVLGVAGVTLLATEVAAIRRLRTPRDRRAAPLARRLPRRATRRTAATALAALVLVTALAYAGAAPSGGDGFSEAYLLTADGDRLVADGYPRNLTAGEPTTFHVAAENHEGTATEYGVVVRLERVTDGQVVERERLDRFAVSVAPDERAVVERAWTPTTTGEDLRLRVLVFEGGVPATPSADGADLRLRLWVDVSG